MTIENLQSEHVEQPPVLLENQQTSGDPLAAWKAIESPETPDVLEALAEMDSFLGVQEIGKWVFLMKAKYVEGVKEDSDMPMPIPFQEMALCVEKEEVGELQMMHLDEWREEAVRRLLAEAEVWYLTDDFDERVDNTEKTRLFALQRRRTNIAKITRRGLGNVVIGTAGALKALSVDEEWSKGFWAGIQKVEVPDGYAGMTEDFAMVGYKGKSKYDSAIALSLAPKPMKSGKYFGSIVGSNIAKYWKRII